MARNDKSEESCGKVENQTQVSHFPTAISYVRKPNGKTGGLRRSAGCFFDITLRLLAPHFLLRKALLPADLLESVPSDSGDSKRRFRQRASGKANPWKLALQSCGPHARLADLGRKMARQF